MTLDWLEFDYSEDAEGNGSFDAMAAASPAQLAALESEIVSVLAWAHAHFGDPLPPDEGGEWHYELQGLHEVSTPLHVDFAGWGGNPSPPQRLHSRPGASAAARVTLTLTIGGTPNFCAALREQFDLS
jgi:hypothetical protein